MCFLCRWIDLALRASRAIGGTALTQFARSIVVLACLLTVPGVLSIADAEDYPVLNGPTDATRPNGASYQPGAVRPATHQETTPAAFQTTGTEKPLLLPSRPGDSSGEKSSGPRTMGAIVSVIASLAIVLGLFFVVAWMMRRTLPASTRRLPDDVVETLGRAPLAGRQQMHLLRFGNKLLLVCVSPTGVDTLAEITDPMEIERVTELCAKTKSSGATKAFKQIFGQMSGDKPLAASPPGSRKASFSSAGRTSAIAGEAADV
jgi:flagellar biogenesis protein FliO